MSNTLADKRAVRIIFVNCITGIRVILIPFFILSEMEKNYISSLSLVIVMLATDIADGFFARKLDAVSSLGGVFDNLADFAVVFSLFTFFSLEKVLSAAIPAAILVSFSVYSINCLTRVKIVYTKFGRATGFICMLILAIVCTGRVFLPACVGLISLPLTLFFIAYFGLSAIENIIYIIRR